MCHQTWQVHLCQTLVREPPPPENYIGSTPPEKRPEICNAPVAVYKDIYGTQVQGDPCPCPSDPKLKLCEAGLFWVTMQKALTVEQIIHEGRCPNDMDPQKPLQLTRPLRIEYIYIPDPQWRLCRRHKNEKEAAEWQKAKDDKKKLKDLEVTQAFLEWQRRKGEEEQKKVECERMMPGKMRRIGQGESSVQVKTGHAYATMSASAPSQCGMTAKSALANLIQKSFPTADVPIVAPPADVPTIASPSNQSGDGSPMTLDLSRRHKVHKHWPGEYSTATSLEDSGTYNPPPPLDETTTPLGMSVSPKPPPERKSEPNTTSGLISGRNAPPDMSRVPTPELSDIDMPAGESDVFDLSLSERSERSETRLEPPRAPEGGSGLLMLPVPERSARGSQSPRI